jgi:hypothetical protein
MQELAVLCRGVTAGLSVIRLRVMVHISALGMVGVNSLTVAGFAC